MELNQYIRLLRRWWWLLIIAAALGAAWAYNDASKQVPRYVTKVTIAVGNAFQSANPDWSQIQLGKDLVFTYAEIIKTRDILQSVVDALELPFGPDALRGLVNTENIQGTSLMRIVVTFTDPAIAADIANEVARQLIVQSPSNLNDTQREQVTTLEEQIDAQLGELVRLRDLLASVDTNLQDTSLTSQAAENFREQRDSLMSQINEASANLGYFQATLTTLQQRTNSIEIVERAQVATTVAGISVTSKMMTNVVLNVGFVLAVVVVIEYLNETYRVTDDVTKHLELPVLGVISKFGGRNDSYNQRLIVNMPSFSQPSEEYRTLRTNVLHTTGDENRAYLISSSSPQEGKSVTSTNLAISMALSGLRVLLIDADLRRPRVHESFDLPNDIGLSTLLTRRTSENSSEELQFGPDSWVDIKQETGIPNLSVITSGFIPTNPTELLGSDLMKYWVQQFRKSKLLDVVIFDSPPVLAVPDSTELAASLKLKVLLVIRATKTRRSAAQKAKERFVTVNADLVGVILNQANLREESYYGYNYSYYYTPTGQSSGGQS